MMMMVVRRKESNKMYMSVMYFKTGENIHSSSLLAYPHGKFFVSRSDSRLLQLMLCYQDSAWVL